MRGYFKWCQIHFFKIQILKLLKCSGKNALETSTVIYSNSLHANNWLVTVPSVSKAHSTFFLHISQRLFGITFKHFLFAKYFLAPQCLRSPSENNNEKIICAIGNTSYSALWLWKKEETEERRNCWHVLHLVFKWFYPRDKVDFRLLRFKGSQF